MAILNRNTRKA